MNCLHCYAYRFRGLKELATDEALRIVEEAGETGVTHIGFSGGEVLTRKDFFKLVEKAREYDVEITVVLSGLLVNEYIAEKLAKNEVYVYLSFDGSERRIHEALRGPGSWKHPIRAARLFLEKGVWFSTVMAVCKLNFRNAGNYVRFASNIGADCACLIPVMPSGRASKDLVLNPVEVVRVLKEVEYVAEELGYHASLWCTPFAGVLISSPYVHHSNCRTWHNIDLDPAGNALLCDVLDIKITSVAGRKLEEAVKEYEEHPLVRKVSQPVRQEPCSSCPLRNRCMGGCYARAWLIEGSLEKPDPLCPRVAGVVELGETLQK